MRRKSLSTNDIVALSTSAGLVDELFQSGAISEIERAALLKTAWHDAAEDRAADDSRYITCPSLPRNSNLEESAMNPKSIIQSIELNRAVMEAQYEKLAMVAPRVPHVSFGHGDSAASVSTLLNAAVRGHLQGAADALHAIAEVEANIRARASESKPSTTRQGERQPVVIDVEAVVIQSKE